MHTDVHGERTLTDLDFARLTKPLCEQRPSAFSEMLDGVELTNPRGIPADLMTMSRIEIVDVHTSRREVLTICYPRDAEPAAGFISVLSPVGSSLPGLRVLDTAKWLTPDGEHWAAEIVAIHRQPEANGDRTR